jgi:hypothetical protein
MDEARDLRLAWQLKGNPPCEHSETEKEYEAGRPTGDYICTTCGLAVDPQEQQAG